MNEPSVLDYIKEKLRFWKKTDLQLPDAEEINEAAPNPGIETEAAIHPREEVSTKKVLFPGIRIPWRAIIALVIAIIGQGLLEPPNASKGAALALYLAATALLIWSAISNEWKIADTQDRTEIEWPIFKIRWQFLLAGSLLTGLTYLAFNGYVFNFIAISISSY
jgi:hypothetical protein